MNDLGDYSDDSQRTPEDILARHLTLIGPPLSDDDRLRLLEAGLVEEQELVRDDTGPGRGDWSYAGDRWSVIYRDGRPRLVPQEEAWEEPLTCLQRVEREFANAVLISELLCGYAATDDDIAELRGEPPWSASFAEAQRADSRSLHETEYSSRRDRHD